MFIRLNPERSFFWTVQKIAVIGPTACNLPLAALLSKVQIRIGTEKPAEIVMVQFETAVPAGSDDLPNTALNISQNIDAVEEADIFFIGLPIQKKVDSYEPDYSSLFNLLTELAATLRNRPTGKVPLLLFESILAPTTMISLIKQHFEGYHLLEGRDILLGNSPGRLLENLSDEQLFHTNRLVAGLHPETPRMIREVYRQLNRPGKLFHCNSTTAEIISILYNVCTNVRKVFSLEITGYCDAHDIDFFEVKTQIHEQLKQAGRSLGIPEHAPLSPIWEVKSPCLSNDDLLLWWRKIDNGADISNSLILQSRLIKDQLAFQILNLMERTFEDISGRHITILGNTCYIKEDDTVHSPTRRLILELLNKNCTISLYDSFVGKNSEPALPRGMSVHICKTLEEAVSKAHYIILGPNCTHPFNSSSVFSKALHLKGILDACNFLHKSDFEDVDIQYAGFGKGRLAPQKEFIQFVFKSLLIMERGLANEIHRLILFLNSHYITDPFNEVHFEEVRKLASDYYPDCLIADIGAIKEIPEFCGFRSRLVTCAKTSYSEVV